MARTISGTYAGGVTLTTVDSPTTITRSGRVTSAGGFGVRISSTNFTLVDLGTVAATRPGAIGITASGTLDMTLGSASDLTASVTGNLAGVSCLGYAHIVNFGSIDAKTGAGIITFDYGTISNGSTADRTAHIAGQQYGINVSHANLAVTNYGTISGRVAIADTGQHGYLEVHDQGTIIGADIGIAASSGARTDVVIGATSNDTASVVGGTFGISSSYFADIRNYGTIDGLQTAGISLHIAQIENGSSADHLALIEGGRYGVLISGSGGSVNVINYGIIQGTTGVAAQDGSGLDVFNRGTIIGSGGVGISAGNGQLRLYCVAGSSIDGVVAGGVNNRLYLQ